MEWHDNLYPHTEESLHNLQTRKWFLIAQAPVTELVFVQSPNFWTGVKPFSTAVRLFGFKTNVQVQGIRAIQAAQAIQANLFVSRTLYFYH